MIQELREEARAKLVVELAQRDRYDVMTHDAVIIFGQKVARI